VTLNQSVRAQALELLNANPSSQQEAIQLNNALRLFSKWRSVLIQNTLLQLHGTKVMHGPLTGMDFLSQSAEGCHVAKIIGTYEQPLQPYISDAIDQKYETILNIGCAEGYYAVGMARAMPETKIWAFDLDANAQKVCTELALKNKVKERIQVGALFKAEDFSAYTNQHTLVLCDIEGAEKELLGAHSYPALCHMDLIVESHECLIPGITQELIERFKISHDITIVNDNGLRSLGAMPEWFNQLAHLDQLLATWEWRSGPTPWLVMRARRT